MFAYRYMVEIRKKYGRTSDSLIEIYLVFNTGLDMNSSSFQGLRNLQIKAWALVRVQMPAWRELHEFMNRHDIGRLESRYMN